MRSSNTLAGLLLVFSLTLSIGVLQGCASGPPLTPTQLGYVALESGDWRAAKGYFATALRTHSRDGKAWLGQARAQLDGRDPEAALRSLASLAKVDGPLFAGEAGRATYADGLDAVAWRRLEREQPEAALASVRALARLDPNRRGLGRLLGKSLVEEASRRRFLGDKETALGLYYEACQATPDELAAWVGAAEILLEEKKGKQAMQLLEMARKNHPTAGAIRSLSLQALHDR